MTDINPIDTLAIDQRARQMRADSVALQIRALGAWLAAVLRRRSGRRPA